MKTIADKITELNNNLIEIAPQVTQAMRMQWAIDNDTSLTTVNRYLKGEAKMTVFAEKLYRDMCLLLGKSETIEAQ